MKFSPGDITRTTNSRVPALNTPALVVVVSVDPTRRDYRGVPTPYEIRRVDGQRFACSSNVRTGHLSIPGTQTTCAREDQLVKPDLREGWTDQEAIEQRALQRAMEVAVFGQGA